VALARLQVAIALEQSYGILKERNSAQHMVLLMDTPHNI